MTARKLKGRLKKLNPVVECYLKDISRNKQVLGCSGFIRNPKTGTIVHVYVERVPFGPLGDDCSYRIAHSLDNNQKRQKHMNCKIEDLVDIVTETLKLSYALFSDGD